MTIITSLPPVPFRPNPMSERLMSATDVYESRGQRALGISAWPSMSDITRPTLTSVTPETLPIEPAYRFPFGSFGRSRKLITAAMTAGWVDSRIAA